MIATVPGWVGVLVLFVSYMVTRKIVIYFGRRDKKEEFKAFRTKRKTGPVIFRWDDKE